MWKAFLSVTARSILHQKIVLHDRPRDANGVAFLEGVQTDRRGRHLPGDDHHRDGVHVGGRDARDGVGHAGAGGDERNTDFARGAGIAIGSMNRSLLVPHQDVLDGFLLVKRVVDIQDGATWVAPEELDSLGLKAANEDFRAIGLSVRI
jgi:hypothetical protein